MTDVALRPPFSYFGGKTRLARWISSLLPVGRHYVEPFAGMASVLLARQRAPLESLSDTDADLINWWLTAQRDSELLARSACVEFPPRSASLLGDMQGWLEEGTPPAWPEHDSRRAIVWMRCAHAVSWRWRRIAASRSPLAQPREALNA